mmetsp:Transcript_18886/g.24897  ORF Transcript_18886/g.24897 Transcript_18886/m.24897 type:complete len:88 (-) Transcript_18886:97-360(-)
MRVHLIQEKVPIHSTRHTKGPWKRRSRTIIPYQKKPDRKVDEIVKEYQESNKLLGLNEVIDKLVAYNTQSPDFDLSGNLSEKEHANV